LEVGADPIAERLQSLVVAYLLRKLVVERGELGTRDLDVPDPQPLRTRRALLLGVGVGDLDGELVLLTRLQRTDRILDRRERLATADLDLVLPRATTPF